MSEIVERMAIAMEKWALDNADLVAKCTSREMSMGMVRAGLEAIRVPTDRMCIAGYEHQEWSNGEKFDNRRELARGRVGAVWDAMIAEALK